MIDNKQYLPKYNGLLEKLVRNLRRSYYSKYLAEANPTGPALEIGCGPGYFLKTITEKYPNVDVYAYDVEPSLVSYAQSLVPTARIRVFQDGQAWDFGTAFSTIYCFQVVEHIEDPRKLFLSVARNLSAKGKFIFTTPNPNSIGAKLMGKNWQGIRDDHVSVLTRDEWEELIAEAGLHMESYGSTFLNGIPVIGRGPLAFPFYILQYFCGWLSWSIGESHVFVVSKRWQT